MRVLFGMGALCVTAGIAVAEPPDPSGWESRTYSSAQQVEVLAKDIMSAEELARSHRRESDLVEVSRFPSVEGGGRSSRDDMVAAGEYP